MLNFIKYISEARPTGEKRYTRDTSKLETRLDKMYASGISQKKIDRDEMRLARRTNEYEYDIDDQKLPRVSTHPHINDPEHPREMSVQDLMLSSTHTMLHEPHKIGMEGPFTHEKLGNRIRTVINSEGPWGVHQGVSDLELGKEAHNLYLNRQNLIKKYKSKINEVRDLKIRPNKLATREVQGFKVGGEYVRKTMPVPEKYKSGEFASTVDRIVDRFKSNPEYKHYGYTQKDSGSSRYKPLFFQSYTPGQESRHEKFYNDLTDKSTETLTQKSKRISTSLGKYSSSVGNSNITDYVRSLFLKPKAKKTKQEKMVADQSYKSPEDIIHPHQAHKTLENIIRAKRFTAPHDMVLYRIAQEHPHENIPEEENQTHFGNVKSKSKRQTVYSTNRIHSYTSNPEYLNKFYTKGSKSHVIRLHVPKGTSLYVPHEHSYYKESEFLLPPTSEVHMHNKPRKHYIMSPEMIDSDNPKGAKRSEGPMWTASVKNVPSRLNILRTLRGLKNR
jgi:hypothetical protein